MKKLWTALLRDAVLRPLRRRKTPTRSAYRPR